MRILTAEKDKQDTKNIDDATIADLTSKLSRQTKKRNCSTCLNILEAVFIGVLLYLFINESVITTNLTDERDTNEAMFNLATRIHEDTEHALQTVIERDLD